MFAVLARAELHSRAVEYYFHISIRLPPFPFPPLQGAARWNHNASNERTSQSIVGQGSVSFQERQAVVVNEAMETNRGGITQMQNK